MLRRHAYLPANDERVLSAVSSLLVCSHLYSLRFSANTAKRRKQKCYADEYRRWKLHAGTQRDAEAKDSESDIDISKTQLLATTHALLAMYDAGVLQFFSATAIQSTRPGFIAEL